MDTIATYDLDEYWINFAQLLSRWNTKIELIAYYCVCVEAARGNPSLIPHFYQGEFPSPSGGSIKRLVKYEQEYRSYGAYLNKNKSEAQLIREFIENIVSKTPLTEIWFRIDDVISLEREDYSLAAAARFQSRPLDAAVNHNINDTSSKQINIPKHIWANKLPFEVVADMRAGGFPEDAIAYTLYTWCGMQNKTEIDSIMRKKDIGDSAKNKAVNKLLKIAEGRYCTR